MKNKKSSKLPSRVGRRKLWQLLLVLVVFTGAGAYYLHSSFAAATFVSSGVVTDQNGSARPGVVLDDCRGNQRTTNASGAFQFTYPQYTQHCFRIAGLPQYTSNPVATRRRPEQASTNSYEWQIAGADCYHNTTYCGPNGSVVKTDIQATYDDLVPENIFNFSVTYAPPAPPVTPPPVSNPPAGGGSSGGGTTKKPAVSTGNAAPATAAPDTSAPSTPGDLSAVADEDNKTVKLSWNASTDNIGVTGYAVERSTDEQDWATIADSVTDTSFEDNTVSFGSTLHYRVRAFDAAGNTSEYSVAQVTTSDFSANAHADQDSNIDSEDGVVSIFIPSGAVAEDVFCGVQVVNNVLSPDVEGYQQASGPYEVTCRKKDGTVLSSFDKSLTATIKLGSNQLKKAGTLAYYGQKDTNWDKLNITGHDKKAKTDTVDLNGHQIFTLMKKHKKKSILLTIFQVLLVLLLIAGAILAILRFRKRRQLQGQYDDYLHKSRGY